MIVRYVTGWVSVGALILFTILFALMALNGGT